MSTEQHTTKTCDLCDHWQFCDGPEKQWMKERGWEKVRRHTPTGRFIWIDACETCVEGEDLRTGKYLKYTYGRTRNAKN